MTTLNSSTVSIATINGQTIIIMIDVLLLNIYIDFNSSQFAALRTAHIFSVHIYDGLTAVLLGGLYLIWCDIDITTNSAETLVLVLVYVFFIKNFVADYCHSMEAISSGKGSLEKLKVRLKCH